MKQVLGVLGGMGPRASLDFVKAIFDVAEVNDEVEYPHIILDSKPDIPSRTRAFLYGDTDPVPLLTERAVALKNAGATLIAVPCNSAHYFLPKVIEQCGVAFLDIIDVTCSRLHCLQWKSVSVLGGEVTIQAGLYKTRLATTQVEVVPNTPWINTCTRQIIDDVKRNQISNITISKFEQILNEIGNGNSDGVILACTELQALLDQYQPQIKFIDSTKELAIEAARQCGIYPEAKIR